MPSKRTKQVFVNLAGFKRAVRVLSLSGPFEAVFINELGNDKI